MQPNYVKVRVTCKRRHQTMNLCVRVERGVPEPLRCSPSGGSPTGGAVPDSGGALCDECQELLRGQRLAEIVNSLTRHGWSEHLRAGTVDVTC